MKCWLNMLRQRQVCKCLAFSWMLIFGGHAVGQDGLVDDAFSDLMDMEVVSSSKFKQDLAEVTASVFIITAEDIKHSGATDLPSLLKQVPGLFIAEVSSNSWAMGIRGFNSVFSNKMLVMIDGRSLFSPIFSGVFWEQLDLFLPDIERIEVIRGVGSTVWGANAVNGVVNIITKSTLDNESTHFYSKLGTHVEYDVGLRFGADVSEHSYARAYLKTKEVDSNEYTAADGIVDDSWSSDAVGFKWEHYDGPDSLFVSSDFIHQHVKDTSLTTARATSSSVPLTNEVYNISAQWQRQIDIDKAFTLAAQLQSTDRDADLYQIKDDLINIEFDTNFKWADHQVLVGAGFRRHDIDFIAIPGFETRIGNDTNTSRNEIFSAYIQDEWRLAPQHSVALGTKFESHVHEDMNSDFRYKDNVWLPTFRYRYDLSDNSRLWFAVSRSARIPSIGEHSVKIPLFLIPPFFGEVNPTPWMMEVFSSGNENFSKEKLLSYEAGIRSNVNANNRVDVAIFYNKYDDVRSFVLDMPTCASGATFPLCLPNDSLLTDNNFTNLGDLDIKGLEFSWLSRISEQINLNFHYVWMAQNHSRFTQNQVFEESTQMLPKHQFNIQLNWQYSDKLNLFMLHKYMGHIEDDFLPLLSQQEAFLSHYHSLDITTSYQWSSDIHITLVLENLLQSKGQKWTPEFPNSRVSLSDKRATFGLDVKF